MDKASFFENLIDYSITESNFLFLDDRGRLSSPKRLSAAKSAAGQAALIGGAMAGLALLGGGTTLIPLWKSGQRNHDLLVTDLHKLAENITGLIGMRLSSGVMTLRLGIDADCLPADSLVRLFGVIQQRSFVLVKHVDSYGGYVSVISQGIVAYSEHSRAREFANNFADKCVHRRPWASWPKVTTQPWIIDLEDEVVTRCAGFWEFAHHYSLDSKKALARLFYKRRDLSS